MCSEGKEFLVVGLACLDIVVVCKKYPEEDTDTRQRILTLNKKLKIGGNIFVQYNLFAVVAEDSIKKGNHQDGVPCISLVIGPFLAEIWPFVDIFGTNDYYWQRGGNAANSSSVLSRLGAKTELLGAMASDMESTFLRQDLKRYEICFDQCPVYSDEVRTPTSVIVINEENGSRTIMHTAKNLPEVTYDDFAKTDISKYKWIHFEGRPTADEISKMMYRINEYNDRVVRGSQIKTSLELEKVDRPQLDPLMGLVDYVYVSKELAMSVGCLVKEDAVRSLVKKCRQGAYVICPWGDDGAAAMSSDGSLFTAPVFSPNKLVDTLGAGDTFLAASILGLSRGKSIQESIDFGCRVAGTKCGMKGYMDLNQFAEWV